MRFVWLWVTRPDGLVEQHIGPFGQYVRDEQGRAVQAWNAELGRVEPVYDEKYVERVMELVGGFDDQSAGQVAMSLDKDSLDKDETGALTQLAAALTEIAKRVVLRQQRTEQGRQRATELADFELETMKVHVRAE